MPDALLKDEQLRLKEKELEIRLKEIDVANKEYDQTHRPSSLSSNLTNPVVIAAAIAAWATLSATGVTWLSGKITADAQRLAVVSQAQLEDMKFKQQTALEELKFQANLITESIKTGNHPDQAAANLQFLVNTGLLSGTLGEKVRTYLEIRHPGEGASK
jgi:hypothetical protein